MGRENVEAEIDIHDIGDKPYWNEDGSALVSRVNRACG
jgi:hypothetical protein